MKQNKRKRNLYLGYAEFEGIGGYGEELINELIQQGIPVSHFRMTDGRITGRVSPLHYPTCARIARKHSVRLRCTGRRGIYFTLSRYKNRAGLYIGALLFILMMTYWQSHVQDISIVGNVSHTQVRQILQQCGIEKGASVQGLPFDKARLELLLQVNNAAWVDINCEGYRVLVNIQTATDKTDVHIDTKNPTNIISTRDAVILDYKVKNGSEAVSRGSAVRKGQLLISGTMLDAAGNLHYEQAEAEVIGEFYETQQFYVPFNETIHLANGQQTEYKYLIFMNDIYPLFFGTPSAENAVYKEQTERIRIMGIDTPFYLRTGTFTQYTDVEIVRTADDCLRELQHLRADFEDNFYSDYTIVNALEDCRADDNGISLTVSYTLQGNIGEEREISISQHQ